MIFHCIIEDRMIIFILFSLIKNLKKFEPFPKNLTIAKVFREIGLADELGSGMRNTYKYTQLYSE